MAKKRRAKGTILSTEPQARKVLEALTKFEETLKDTATGNTTTAKSPPGLNKKKEDGLKELEELRAKQRARRKKNKDKK